MQFHSGYAAMADALGAMDRGFYDSRQADDGSSIRGNPEENLPEGLPSRYFDVGICVVGVGGL